MEGLPHRLANRPLALHLGHAAGLATAWQASPAAALAMDDDRPSRAYGLIDGVAVIPVQGILMPGDFAYGSWATGYDWIRRGVAAAAAASDVRAIVLDVDSPGGTVTGCFDLADAIYAARGPKPIHAILGENAYSAAYAIASAADRITVPRTGGTGSIGVIWMHVDWSAALAEAGIKVTVVAFGARKADGHPEMPLAKEALARIQADIDTMGDLFVRTVARNRGLSADKVRETEAATFLGDDGVSIGLADAVMAPDAAFRALLAELG
ncbi:MAG: S49 family peptidase [Magnetospirillum sp.]|nr:S49 family peptidase [Magnetospirillum sp.]